jgi:hypothetical protein
MDEYTPPSVTEYGDAHEITRATGWGFHFDGSFCQLDEVLDPHEWGDTPHPQDPS